MTSSRHAAPPPRRKMDAWRRRFVRIVLLVAFALEVPFGVLLASLWARVTSVPVAALLAIVCVLLVNVPLFLRLSRWSDETRASAVRVWLFEVPFFVHFCASVAFGPLAWIALAVLGVLALAGTPAALPLYRYLGPIYLGSALLSVYATFVRRFWTPVRTIEVPVEGLDDALDGYTFVHLSDLHCGPYLPRWFYRSLARRASSVGADAVVLTGDMIADGAAYLDDVEDFVRHLGAPDGVFASMGNHDYFGTVEGVAEAMRRGGARVLRNEGTALAAQRGGGIHIAAIDDTWSRRADLAKAMARRPSEGPCVLLAHDPAVFDDVAARGDVDLMLSGHTHGGQVAVPFLARKYNLAALRYAHTLGVYTRDRTTLFVHRGNGTSGPPARFGAAPEIAKLVLRRAATSSTSPRA